MYKSDLTRLKACMRRAEAGEDVTLGFFGGSITQDSLATKHEYCYAYRVFQWWEKTFPKAKLHYVNGGIGGTTSHYGGIPRGNRYVDVSAGFCSDRFFCE